MDSKEYRVIKPSLFKIEIAHHSYYVIAYDAKDAIETANLNNKEMEELKGVTNLTHGFGGYLYIDPKCLGVPDLVNKKVKR